jgi:Na+-transporting NADH:ubiquinone oxidoreductase subunit C
MAINTDKNSYTFIFAIIMVVIVGALLAFVSSSLSETISENIRLEKQQNILYAMGVNNNDEGSVEFISTTEVANVFDTYIKKQLVLQGGQITENEEAFLIDLKKEGERAKNGEERRLPIFIGEKDGKTYHILPMLGKGLWDAIWGYVALDDHLVIQGVYFDHKGETPGLGANIKQRFFMDDFTGESIMDSDKIVGVKVIKGNNDPLNTDKLDNEVDALAGATITGNGLSAMLADSFKLYENYLNSILVH